MCRLCISVDMRAGQKFCSSIDCVGQEKIVRIALGRIEVIDWADLDDMDSGRGYDFIVVGGKECAWRFFFSSRGNGFLLALFRLKHGPITSYVFSFPRLLPSR